MQEYNNTASYPDSVRAARIEVMLLMIMVMLRWSENTMMEHWYNNTATYLDSVRAARIEVA